MSDQNRAATVGRSRGEWLAPGRKTVEGYLLVSGGMRKGRLSMLDQVFIDVLEEKAGRVLHPRYPDLHAVWFDHDPSKEPGYQMVRPLVRYKATRPIDGLSSECNGHRVELSATFGQPFSNGMGAYITRASGRCLTCEQSGSSAEATS